MEKRCIFTLYFSVAPCLHEIMAWGKRGSTLPSMMEWSQPHELTTAEVRRRLDRFLDGLMGTTFPAGVKLRHPHAAWNENRLEFRFRLERGFLGGEFHGEITVQEHQLQLRCQLPTMLGLLVGEDKAKTFVTRNLNELLDPAGKPDAKNADFNHTAN